MKGISVDGGTVTLGAMTKSLPLRATLGVSCAWLSTVMQRETMPYFDKPTGFLHTWASMTICFTFFCGLIVTSDAFKYEVPRARARRHGGEGSSLNWLFLLSTSRER